jgi:hypothetical protein
MNNELSSEKANSEKQVWDITSFLISDHPDSKGQSESLRAGHKNRTESRITPP